MRYVRSTIATSLESIVLDGSAAKDIVNGTWNRVWTLETGWFKYSRFVVKILYCTMLNVGEIYWASWVCGTMTYDDNLDNVNLDR